METTLCEGSIGGKNRFVKVSGILSLFRDVMSPVVDFQVAIKFRGELMGWQLNMKATPRMLTSFGFSENDLPEGGKIISPEQ